MKKALPALTIVAILSCHALAANRYWDVNNAGAGAGGPAATGTWSAAGTTWSTDNTPGNTTAPTAWTASDVAIFSAGTDATGISDVTLSGTHTASGLIVEEGTVRLLASGAVALAGNNVTVNTGTTFAIDNSARVSTTAGSKVFLDGSTLQNFTTGAAGTFFDTDSEIVLGGGGGTFSFPSAGVLNIVQIASKISGTGSLTKTGAGVLAFSTTPGNNTYAGDTIVNDGELRLRNSTANNLPTTTNLIVNSPGIFNLNGPQNQQVASLSGSGNVGTGSGTLTIDGSTSTVFSGALKNIANAGAGAVSTGNGRLIKNGSSTITFNGVNDINGSVTLNAGGITVNLGGSLCGDICDVAVNGGTMTLNQAAETIENLSSTAALGTINLNNAALSLISDPVSSTTYSGTITGAGGLTRKNANATTRTLTLTGNNDYTGNTIIDKGIISVGHANALGGTAGYTQVSATGAEVLFTGAGGSVTTSEPFRIAGTGSTDNGAIAVIAAATPTISGPVTLIGDATVTVSSTSGVTFNNANSFSSVSNENLTLKGGSGAGAGGLISGVIALGSGGITKNEGGKWVLTGANTYSGGTIVNAGTLLVNNTTGSGTGSGSVTVNGGRLGGTGTISGNVDVVGGTLAPGASVGTLNIGGNLTLTSGTFEWEFNSTALTADLDNVSGALSIASAVSLFIAPDFGASFLTAGTKFTVISYGSGAPPGTFNGLVENAELTMGGKKWRIKYADSAGLNGGAFPTAGHNVTLTAIPEASSFITIGLGGIFAIGAVWLGKRYGIAIKI